MTSVIALEGSSFAGKSTLSGELSAHFEAPVIQEFIAYAQPEGFPSFATTRAELEAQIEYFADLERARAQDLELAKSQSDVVIVDRTASSLIAFQQAMGSDPAGEGFCWDAAAMQTRILAQQSLGKVIQPTVTLVLSAGSQQEHLRRLAARGPIDTITSLNDWEFSEKVRKATLSSLQAVGATAITECVNNGPPDHILYRVEQLLPERKTP